MGAAVKQSGRDKREEREKFLKLKHRYEHRITIAKNGNIANRSGDFGNSIKKYTDYLGILAEVNKCDIYSLSPDMFDHKKQVTEMLVISQIYFELAKLFDLSERFEGECIKAMDRYIAFSVNQSYQVVNSEVLRKSLRKGKMKHPEHFFAAYKLIQVKSAKCFIATFCFGNDSLETTHLRAVKKNLLKSPYGFELVDFYYRFSPKIVAIAEQNLIIKHLVIIFFKPLLLFAIKITSR
jgi:hypothetical protein